MPVLQFPVVTDTCLLQFPVVTGVELYKARLRSALLVAGDLLPVNPKGTFADCGSDSACLSDTCRIAYGVFWYGHYIGRLVIITVISRFPRCVSRPHKQLADHKYGEDG